MQFPSVSTLIDKVVESQARGNNLNAPTLYLHVTGTDPLHFHDASKVPMVVHQDDLETYLTSYDKISAGTTICLENCEVTLDQGTNNDITSCEIESKSVLIDFGTEKQKKIKNMTLKVHIETKDADIPILPSTRRYISRIQKQEQARKLWNKGSKIDVLNFVNQPSQKSKKKDISETNCLTENLALDTESIDILRKLKNFVDKEDLLRVLIKQPLKNKHSKKVVRLMAVPTLETSDEDSMTVDKKSYERNAVQELLREYQARDSK